MRPIRPIDNNGSIQLKFSYGGKRYSFNPVPQGRYGDPRDMATTQAIATQVQNDILAGHFDTSLTRYRLAPKAAPKAPGGPKDPLDLWDTWVSTLDLPDHTRAVHYDLTRRMLVKGSPRGLTDTSWLTGPRLAPSTYRDRLRLARAWGDWLMSQGAIDTNHYRQLKAPRAPRTLVKPFSRDEVQAIVGAMADRWPTYTPLVQFLFLTGCRPSEAIGLRWSSVDLGRNELTICESMPRDATGNYARVRKGTKTGAVTVVTLSGPLRSLLTSLPRRGQDDLVFPSPQGHPIDLKNFLNRQWKPTLKALGIPYRRPYTTRHTFASHALDQGQPVTDVAYLLGHSDTRMVMTTYGHMVNRPSLPEIL